MHVIITLPLTLPVYGYVTNNTYVHAADGCMHKSVIGNIYPYSGNTEVCICKKNYFRNDTDHILLMPLAGEQQPKIQCISDNNTNNT